MGKMSQIAADQADRRVQDKLMLNRELGDWPWGFVLPIKRFWNEQWETAWVTADYPMICFKQQPTTAGLILQLRWEMTDEQLKKLGFFDPRKIMGEDTKEHYENEILHRYTDVDALLDDGWTVD